MIIPEGRAEPEAPISLKDADQDAYNSICELFEMGAKFDRTASGFEVIYPDNHGTGGKQCEAVLRLDVCRSLRLLVCFGLVPRSWAPETKQQPPSILSPV